MADVLTSTTNICCRPYLIQIFLTWWLDCWVDAGLFIILSDRHWTTSRPDSQKETAVSWVFYQITLAGRDGIIRQVGHRQNATRHKTTKRKKKEFDLRLIGSFLGAYEIIRAEWKISDWISYSVGWRRKRRRRRRQRRRIGTSVIYRRLPPCFLFIDREVDERRGRWYIFLPDIAFTRDYI